MSKEIENIVQTLSSLSIKDALSLVKTLEENWGVSAAAVAAPAATGSADAGEDAAEAEFEVIITSVDSAKKIGLVRHVKDNLGMSLLDAKKFVDGLPQTAKSGLSKSDAEELKKALEGAGATVELKAV